MRGTLSGLLIGNVLAMAHIREHADAKILEVLAVDICVLNEHLKPIKINNFVIKEL